MRSKNKRILSISLVAIAVAILVLGTVLLLTLPPPGTAGFGGFWRAHHGWIQNGGSESTTNPGASSEGSSSEANLVWIRCVG